MKNTEKSNNVKFKIRIYNTRIYKLNSEYIENHSIDILNSINF